MVGLETAWNLLRCYCGVIFLIPTANNRLSPRSNDKSAWFACIYFSTKMHLFYFDTSDIGVQYGVEVVLREHRYFNYKSFKFIKTNLSNRFMLLNFDDLNIEWLSTSIK